MKNKKKLTSIIVLILVIIAVLFFLFLKKCSIKEEPDENKIVIGYFTEKAAELEFNRAKIISWIRDSVYTYEYKGELKGPLATLWDKGGSIKDKLSLANRLLQESSDTKKQDLITLNDISDETEEFSDTIYKLKITHRVLKADGTFSDTEVFNEAVSYFVGDVHTVTIPSIGTTRYVFRNKDSLTIDVSTLGAIGEEIIFTIPKPGFGHQIVKRELWKYDNNVGPSLPLLGDQHDFVVLPCRINESVVKKEKEILESEKREETDAGKNYLGLLDYCLQSDKILEEYEKEKEVKAIFDMPRILVLSKYNIPKTKGGPFYAMDLRWNRTSFEGDSVNAFLACSMRGFLDAGLEQQWFSEWSKRSCMSSFEVFNRLQDDYPTYPLRRMTLAEKCFREFKALNNKGASLVFSAHKTGKDEDVLAKVTIRKNDDGNIVIEGGNYDQAKIEFLLERELIIPVKEDKIEGLIDSDPKKAAIIIENALLATDYKPHVPPDYFMNVEFNRGKRNLLVTGSVLRLIGETKSIHKFINVGKSVTMDFKVWNSSLTIEGFLTLDEDAMETSRLFDRWWYNEELTYNDKTSLVLSRDIYRELKSGKDSKCANGKNLEDATEETLFVTEPSTANIMVNGKDVELPTVCYKNAEGEIRHLLDYEKVPVLKIDKYSSIETEILCRLTDSSSKVIANASVKLKNAGTSAITMPDGSFILPPPLTESYGMDSFIIEKNNEEYGRVAVDLTAPGIDIIDIISPRKRMEAVWLTLDSLDYLASLPLTDEVKKHIKSYIEKGEFVLTPSRMVPTEGGDIIGFYAFDAQTGDITSVFESGINGVMRNMDDIYDDITDDLTDWAKDNGKEMGKEGVSNLIKTAGIEGAMADAMNSYWSDVIDVMESGAKANGMILALHSYRGGLAAMYGYSGHRINQDDKTDHTKALVNTLRDMDMWAGKCDFFEGTEYVGGDDVKDAVEELINNFYPGFSGPAAKAAFKVGYIFAVMGLHKNFGNQPGVK